jgi:uroporphyrinogen decarboxylase
MTSRDRVLAALNFEEADRIPIHDNPWSSTVERWRREGLPAGVSPAEYFDYELVVFGADTSPRLPVRVLEQNEEFIVETTPFGGMHRNRRDYSTTPEVLDYPVKCRADWNRLKERLVPAAERVDWSGTQPVGLTASKTFDFFRVKPWLEWRQGLPGCRQARAAGKFICYAAAIGLDKLYNYITPQELLMLLVTDPAWVRDMYETDTSLVIALCELMRQGGYEFDGAFLYCDLAYKNGLFFSPRMYEEQLQPSFRRLFDYFKSLRMPVIFHTDGRIHQLIPHLVRDGIRCLQPLEVKAGMDLPELKKTWHGKLAFMGGIDTRLMSDPDPSLIEREIRAKITVAKQGGGYLYHCDHTIPNIVSLAQYEHVLACVRQHASF